MRIPHESSAKSPSPPTSCSNPLRATSSYNNCFRSNIKSTGNTLINNVNRLSSNNSLRRGLIRLGSTSSKSFNMFRQKWTGSASSDAPVPSRSSSVFSGISSRANRRLSRTETDAYITLSAGKDDVVTDDELAKYGANVRPARFNLVPVSESNSSDNEGESNNSNDNNSSSNSDDGTQSEAFTQAGGHDGSFLIDGSQLVKKVTTREALFYENAAKGAWPVSLLPNYYGRVGNDAISIENLTYGYSKPCVLDLKMGIHSFESQEKSLFKRLKMQTLDQLTGSRSEGCRLEGLSMYRTVDKQTVNVKGSKRQTHALSMDIRISLQDMLTFFLTDEYGVRTDVASRFQTAIEHLLKQFESNNKFLFIGSSILLIYNNDNQEPHMRWARALRKLHKIAPNVRLSEDQISGLTRRTLCDVKMIDFAHTGPLPKGELKDEGYIRGLRSILKALKAIRVFRSKPIFSFRSAAIDMMEEQRAKNLAAQSSGDAPENGSFTFGTVLKELTAVSHMNEKCSVMSENKVK